jgi:hypothetical protein
LRSAGLHSETLCQKKKARYRVHACNTSYSGGGDQEDGCLRQPGQIVCKTPPHLSQLKSGMVVCACHPTYLGNIRSRMVIQAGPEINMIP